MSSKGVISAAAAAVAAAVSAYKCYKFLSRKYIISFEYTSIHATNPEKVFLHVTISKKCNIKDVAKCVFPVFDQTDITVFNGSRTTAVTNMLPPYYDLVKHTFRCRRSELYCNVNFPAISGNIGKQKNMYLSAIVIFDEKFNVVNRMDRDQIASVIPSTAGACLIENNKLSIPLSKIVIPVGNFVNDVE